MTKPVLLAAMIFFGATAAVPYVVGNKTAPADTIQAESKDAVTLRGLIKQTEAAINSNNPDGILAHYSKEILVSYPGVPDTTYDVFDRSYRQMLSPSTRTSTVATIDEILVSGDLATIRMTWSTTVTEKDTGTSSSRQAKDLQVWRRENGSWKFFRGMWHHVRAYCACPAAQ